MNTFEVTLLVDGAVRKLIVDADGELEASTMVLADHPSGFVEDVLYMGPAAEQSFLPGVL